MLQLERELLSRKQIEEFSAWYLGTVRDGFSHIKIEIFKENIH